MSQVLTAAPVADHGTFTIQIPIERELALLRDAWRLALANQRQPGHHWHRLVARGPDAVPVVSKLYHVDRNAGLVEITENRDGRETARRTFRLEPSD